MTEDISFLSKVYPDGTLHPNFYTFIASGASYFHILQLVKDSELQMALNAGAGRSALSILRKLDAKYTQKDANFVHANIQKYFGHKIGESEDVLAKIEEHESIESQISIAGFKNFVDAKIKALHLLNILPDS